MKTKTKKLTQEQYNQAEWCGFYCGPSLYKVQPIVRFEGRYYDKRGREISIVNCVRVEA